MVEGLNRKPDVVMFLVANDDGTVLVEERKRKGDQFFGLKVIPSGKIENESLLEALDRELLEEMNIERYVTVDLGNVTLESGFLGRAFLIASYKGVPINKEGKNDQMWLCFSEAQEKLTLSSSQMILDRARKWMPGVS